MKTRRHIAVGLSGERQAGTYLQAAGLQVVAQNWRCRLGEIDLVAMDQDTVVFVEVKTRASDRCGLGTEAVDRRKQSRLVRLAAAFLQSRGWSDWPCRFDVVAVEAGPVADRGARITWLRDAFRQGE